MEEHRETRLFLRVLPYYMGFVLIIVPAAVLTLKHSLENPGTVHWVVDLLCWVIVGLSVVGFFAINGLHFRSKFWTG